MEICKQFFKKCLQILEFVNGFRESVDACSITLSIFEAKKRGFCGIIGQIRVRCPDGGIGRRARLKIW